MNDKELLVAFIRRGIHPTAILTKTAKAASPSPL
jgi:hypothetical protein